MKTRMKILTMMILFCLLSGKFYGQTHDCATGFCPDTIFVHHFASDVSPVTVDIAYPILESNLTGTNMCWIAQNLGATVKATDAADNRAAAAGWNWQFNRKQGYFHDGSTRTPNTPWITPINEASNWLPENDPCTLLLGTGWRLPTNTELETADTNGGDWGDSSDAYDSVLKLHAAGYLDYSSVALLNRGTYGVYWSSVRNSSTHGFSLYFHSSNAGVNGNDKANGFSVRCLREL